VPDKQTLRVLDATQLSADKDRINFRLPAAERIEFEIIPEQVAVLPTPNLPRVETAQAVVETATARTRIVSDGALLTEIDYSIRHERALPWTPHRASSRSTTSYAKTNGPAPSSSTRHRNLTNDPDETDPYRKTARAPDDNAFEAPALFRSKNQTPQKKG